jgi:hypothetical protein
MGEVGGMSNLSEMTDIPVEIALGGIHHVHFYGNLSCCTELLSRRDKNVRLIHQNCLLTPEPG